MKLFVDTSGWVALLDRKDPRHPRVTHVYRDRAGAGGTILTSDYVLAETLNVLFLHRPFAEGWRFAQWALAAMAQKQLSVEQVTQGRFLQALDMKKQFAEITGLSFTDLTTVVLLSESGTKEILSGNAQFRRVGLGFHVLPE